MSKRLQVFFPSAIFRMILSRNRDPDQAHFMVPLHFNKYDIKEYLSKLYDIKVKAVNTMIMQVQDKSTNKKKRYKKAIVTLEEAVTLPEFDKEWNKMDVQAYTLRPYFKNYNNPQRMFVPNKGKSKFLLKQVEKIEKRPLMHLLRDKDEDRKRKLSNRQALKHNNKQENEYTE
eukprot:NODE_662_length_5423_cov_0.101991.p5 type:complete len:173 gc:universal NODE_662_length_5423_cov_0.101991:1813-2331(+)